MKKIIAAAAVLTAALLSGCEPRVYEEEDYIEKAREVIPIADAETVDMKLVRTSCVIDGHELVWAISGNENQKHYYLPMEFEEAGQDCKSRCKYNYVHAFKPAERCVDIASLQWKGGCAFLVNNKLCSAVRITSENGVEDIPVTEIPCALFYDKTSNFEYNYIDIDGEEMTMILY